MRFSLILALLLSASLNAQICKRVNAKLVASGELAFYEDPETAKLIPLTGRLRNPLSTILHNLGLSRGIEFTEEVFRGSTIQDLVAGKDVATLGEGRSEFLNLLLWAGAHAQALDVWYGKTDFPANEAGCEMKAFQEKYKDHLVEGTLEELPFPDSSKDFLFSHHVLPYLTLERQKKALEESVRVLRDGGEALHYGFATAEEIAPLIAHIQGESVQVEVHLRVSSWVDYEWEKRLITTPAYLLRVIKLKKGILPRPLTPSTETANYLRNPPNTQRTAPTRRNFYKSPGPRILW